MKEYTGGEAQIPASLELKVQAYEQKVREALYRDGSNFGISLQTADALLADMGALLRYKDEAPHLTKDGYQDLKKAAIGQQNLFGKDSFFDTPAVALNLPLYMTIESYFRAEVFGDQLRQLTDEGLDAAERAEGLSKLIDFLQESPLLTLKIVARNEDIKIVFENFPEELQAALEGGGLTGAEIYQYVFYYTFLAFSATFADATAGELSSIEAPGEIDKEAAIQGAMKMARDYKKKGKNRLYRDISGTDSHIIRTAAKHQAEAAAGIEHDYIEYDPEGRTLLTDIEPEYGAGRGDDSEGAKYFRMWDSVASTLSRQLQVSEEHKQYSGTLRSIAEQNGIGETILYTCFNVIQRIAQYKGVVQTNRLTGQKMHYYRLTLARLGLLAYGRHAHGREIADLCAGFRVLAGHLFPIEEKAIIKQARSKHREYTQFTREVKLFSIEGRIRPSDPDDISPDTTIVDIGIHNFFVEGRTSSESLKGEKEGQFMNILKPRLHLLTEEQEATARRIFKGSPAAHRFYYMLMSMTNLSEEKMIDRIFELRNYYSKLEAAEKNLREYTGELKAAGKKEKDLSEDEAKKIDALKEDIRKARNSIKSARSRCRAKIEELFATAKEAGLLKWYKKTDADPNTKKHGNEKASVWKWARIEKDIKKEDAEEQDTAEA